MPRSTDADRRARAATLTCLMTLALLAAWVPAAAGLLLAVALLLHVEDG